MINKNYQKIILIVGCVGVLIALGWVGYLFYQDNRRSQCQEKAYQNLEGNPNELIEISETEKQELGINITPTKIYYETMKCMVSK